jgi:hypothetical protein
MDVGCSQRGFTALTMTPHHHLGSALPQFSKIWPPPCIGITVYCKGAPICPSTAYEGAQTLYTYPIWMLDTVTRGLQPKPWHHIVIGALPYPIISKFGPHLHKYTSVRVHPCTHPQQHTMKVVRHCIYIWYGCMMQSAGVYSLNHDITTLFGLCLTPIFQNFAPTFIGITVQR